MRKHMPWLLHSLPAQVQDHSPDISGCWEIAPESISNKPTQDKNTNLHREIFQIPMLTPAGDPTTRRLLI